MTSEKFEKAVAEGKNFIMQKYMYAGIWSNEKVVSAEVAEKKSKIRINGIYCPYRFKIAD